MELTREAEPFVHLRATPGAEAGRRCPGSELTRIRLARGRPRTYLVPLEVAARRISDAIVFHERIDRW
jgi:hypothetical protein